MRKPIYKTIVADPPWSYRDKINSAIVREVTKRGFAAEKIRGRRGAAGYYQTMSIAEIKCALPDALDALGGRIAPDAHLYLWTTNAFLEEAYGIARRWGFAPVTILTWVKPQIGMGHYFRNNTEHILFGVRGSLKPKLRNVPTAFTAPRTRVHSEKPQRFYEICESMSPAPYLELFSRRPRPGWTAWGNETDKLAALTA